LRPPGGCSNFTAASGPNCPLCFVLGDSIQPMSRDRSERIAAVVAGALDLTGIELVDVELSGQAGRPLVRVFIDKDGGVSHADCARITRLLGEHFDADPSIGLESYVLEVSSPGIDRPLVKAADFERFRGETAAVITREKILGRSHHLGVIQAVTRDTLILEQPDLGRTEIPLSEVQKANLRRNPWQIPGGGGPAGR
jgi:ribosome maturation factor RimP